MLPGSIHPFPEQPRDPVSHSSAPSWMKPYGLIALGIALFGFVSSSLDARGIEESLFAGLANPFFLLGTLLGVYWLLRSTRG